MSAKKFAAIWFEDTTVNIWHDLVIGEENMNKASTVTVCNQFDIKARIFVALVPNDGSEVPKQSDYLVYNRVLEPYETINLPVVTVGYGSKLVATTDCFGVSVVAYGYEEIV